MTQLTDLMSQGFQIQISDMVPADTVFPAVDPGTGATTLVFNPLNYSYISNDDPLVAHEINMLRIYDNIERAAQEACDNIDDMVDELNRQHGPHILTFLHNTEVFENPDGSFTFAAVGPNEMSFYEPEREPMSEEEIMRRYG